MVYCLRNSHRIPHYEDHITNLHNEDEIELRLFIINDPREWERCP
jgi:hypothetical protein